MLGAGAGDADALADIAGGDATVRAWRHTQLATCAALARVYGALGRCGARSPLPQFYCWLFCCPFPPLLLLLLLLLLLFATLHQHPPPFCRTSPPSAITIHSTHTPPSQRRPLEAANMEREAAERRGDLMAPAEAARAKAAARVAAPRRRP